MMTEERIISEKERLLWHYMIDIMHIKIC